MTFRLELDLDIFKIYLHTKNEVHSPMHSKVGAEVGVGVGAGIGSRVGASVELYTFQLPNP